MSYKREIDSCRQGESSTARGEEENKGEGEREGTDPFNGVLHNKKVCQAKLRTSSRKKSVDGFLFYKSLWTFSQRLVRVA